MARSKFEETRAVARLPHLDIEILYRRPWEGEGEGEQVVVSLRTTPSFEVFERYLEAASPFRFWAGLMQAVWAPWLGALEAATRSLEALQPSRRE